MLKFNNETNVIAVQISAQPGEHHATTRSKALKLARKHFGALTTVVRNLGSNTYEVA